MGVPEREGARPHRRGGRRGVVAGLLLVLAGAASTAPGAGQELDVLVSTCGAGRVEVQALCGEAALALRASRAAVGLLAAGGSDLPGSGSTVGLRLGAIPRVSLSLSAGGVRASFPEILGFPGGAAVPSTSLLLPALRGGLSVGLLNGFSPVPTVGGILSLDLVGSAGILPLPSSKGFDGGVRSWGVGARLGLLRESFTLPGLSVSLLYRRVGSVRMAAPGGAASTAELAYDLRVTSFRAVASKDLLLLGVLVGAGWDRYGGDVSLAVHDPLTGAVGSAEGSAGTDERFVVFGGASLTFLVLQVSGEVGWADAPPIPALSRIGGAFDPGSRSFFGSLAFRLTL